MYAKYITNSGSSQAQILADLVAIYTGTTDVQTLSASCNKTLTEIHTSVNAAGWTVHDAAAGTNTQVIKAPVYDNATNGLFKYVRLSTNVSGYVSAGSGESWNATTHVGTNWMTSQENTGIMQRISFASPTTYFLTSSSRYLFLYTNHSTTVWGNGWTAGLGIFEYTRWSPWDTATAGYPNVLYQAGGQAGNTCYFGRHKNQNGTDTSAFAIAPTITTILSGAPNRVQDSNSVLTIPLVPVVCYAPANGHFGGNISEQCGFYSTVGGLSANPFGDELTVGATQYIYMTSAGYLGGGAIAGSGGLLFPKG